MVCNLNIQISSTNLRLEKVVSKFSDVIKTRVNTSSWDANKIHQTMLNIGDLSESVIISKVIMLE